ncbi:sulfate adenylyltransferase subunit CysN [Carboxylicivirga sp. M1479]|uniref:sulfate adenylyltransferase subunit CysN n=1 Tax=Carboxylicivirga sp. M1479 TaxID=2594476 RepID=UPI0011787A91|nr:sulfate adenylyltransferase subunit CysN [Carboxylicivirga sp. M1479]TRX71993.1 sulfate adenylyltransferase subunit CysN [Carboxylicivirga sp. M1479]
MLNEATLNIKEFLAQDEKKDLLRLLTAGSVDDGKSTLIGRLLFDSKKLYEDQLDALERDSKRVGNAGEEIDYALLLDGLKAEREQGITIDVAYRYFSTNKRKFIIADTPGHEQYTRNMITGGSTANLAIILVDARTGVITQTKRHTFIASLLGIKHVVLAVNKMDLVGYSEERYMEICKEYAIFAKELNVKNFYTFPLSALKGDNVVDRSKNTSWYKGECLLEFLEKVEISKDRNYDTLRYPVQYVNRPNLDFRGFCGKVSSGLVKKGDVIVALPSGKSSTVTGIHTYDGEVDKAFPPQSVTLTLADEIDISRGDMIVHQANQPVVTQSITAMLVWMDEKPLNKSTQFYLKHANNSTKALITSIRHRVDVNTLETSSVDSLELNAIASVEIHTVQPILVDKYQDLKDSGAFILIDPINHNTIAVGMISEAEAGSKAEFKSEGEVFTVNSNTELEIKTQELIANGRRPIVLIQEELGLSEEQLEKVIGCLSKQEFCVVLLDNLEQN